ncbi:hypothetical protein T12_8233 [Trichinella patagoniensis]|uniref:G-protein coupled receptors family 1 profile domain-containing protein n=1 Tax=Trichinella patagoniensis TaxID=990121 RepID=A0A0V1ACC4_9BILA|nr:hypothetical protein T12_8233 [Trichinella patagoniensis]
MLENTNVNESFSLNISAINDNDEDVTVYILSSISGLIAVITNVLFIFAMVRVKTDSRVKKYLLAFSFGCAIKGFSISFANIERLLEETDVKVPVSHCLKPVPNVLLNMFSLWLTTLSLFFMAVDRLVAIRSIKLSTTAKLKLRSHRFLFAVISLSILNSVAILADCIKRRDVKVYSVCYDSDLLARWHYIYHLLSSVGIGYSTVLIYCYAMVLLKRNVVSASDSIRISQIRREETAMLKIRIIIFFTFLLRNIPSSFHLAYILNKNLIFIRKFLFIADNINLSIYATYSIASDAELRNALLNSCICGHFCSDHASATVQQMSSFMKVTSDNHNSKK